MTIEGNTLAGRRILVVEDNFNIAAAMARILKKQGVEIVGPAGTVADALDAIAKCHHIDAAVLDINLRGETAYTVVDVLRLKGVPTVFMTGYDKTSVKLGYTDVPCLQKPLSVEHLMQILST